MISKVVFFFSPPLLLNMGIAVVLFKEWRDIPERGGDGEGESFKSCFNSSMPKFPNNADYEIPAVTMFI